MTTRIAHGLGKSIALGMAQGIAQGLARGIADGMAQGIARGMALGTATSLLELLSQRGVHLTAEQRSRIATCSDPATLARWFERARAGVSADELLE